MKDFVVYINNGKVVRSGICQDETFSLQANDGEFILEAEFSGNQYVENGVLVDMPEQPNENYIFDYNVKQWVFDNAKATADALQQRDALLRDGPDRISPIWYDSMTQEEKTAWANYRQALLDITSQPNFPHDIIWPIKPGTGEQYETD